MPDAGIPSFEQTPKVPERGLEVPDHGPSFEAPATAAERAPAPSSIPAPAPAPVVPQRRKDPTTLGVERIMEESLADTYAHLPPELQAKFRTEGERVAGRIAEMVRTAKVRAREVLTLISGWLKIIPGVNRFFLIQEAKIKTDRILALAKEEKSRRNAP